MSEWVVYIFGSLDFLVAETVSLGEIEYGFPVAHMKRRLPYRSTECMRPLIEDGHESEDPFDEEMRSKAVVQYTRQALRRG